MIGPTEPREEIAADLHRVASRLRGAPQRRVGAVAGRARTTLQLLADVAAGAEARTAGEPPPWRAVPVLIDTALGDQLAVLGADLMTAIGGVGDPEPIWDRQGRVPLGEALEAVAATLKELRLAL